MPPIQKCKGYFCHSYNGMVYISITLYKSKGGGGGRELKKNSELRKLGHNAYTFSINALFSLIIGALTIFSRPLDMPSMQILLYLCVDIAS